MFPPRVHTIANRKRPWSHMVICWLVMVCLSLVPDAEISSRYRAESWYTCTDKKKYAFIDKWSTVLNVILTNPSGRCTASLSYRPSGWEMSAPQSNTPCLWSPDRAELTNQIDPQSVKHADIWHFTEHKHNKKHKPSKSQLRHACL